MALVREGLWKFVDGTQPVVREGEEGYAKYVEKRDHALAIVVLSVDLSLLYVLGKPDDPVKAWSKLREQFMKKSRVNRLELRRELYSLRLSDGESVKEHIKRMT